MKDKASAILEAQHRIIKALAHPQRLMIVEEIADREKSLLELSQDLEISAQAVTNHLFILKTAGIVTEAIREGKTCFQLRLPCVKRFLKDIRSNLEADAQEEFLRILGYV